MINHPKVFISYSWSSPEHKAKIWEWAELLRNDGVDVVLDHWDLKEGNDKYAFMEKMVTDKSVTHVLVFSDSEYAAKADARKAGVGAESQIISGELYKQVQQSKFIPIVCEFDDSSEPFLPTFLKNRIWIDFSSSDAVIKNWKRLVLVLFDKPAYEKPVLGQPPDYITSGVSVPASPLKATIATLEQAIRQEKRGLKAYRESFLDSCYSYVNELCKRARPNIADSDQRLLEECSKLKLVRNPIVDWVLLESGANPSVEFCEALVLLLEKLLELKSLVPEVVFWNDVWSEAYQLFVYETFLYIVAALLKCEAFDCLHLILTNHYLVSETEASRAERSQTFSVFYYYSRRLQFLASKEIRLHAPAAELIKRQADHSKLSFQEVMEADLLVLMMAFIVEEYRWYPQTLHYSSYLSQYSKEFPFFFKAKRHRDFQKLAKITGVSSGDELREAVKLGHTKLEVSNWNNFWNGKQFFWERMNMDDLDTLS